MKLLIRYFSLGLFTAGILMLGILFFSDNNNAEELSTEEIIPKLKNEGYHVLTNDEYISLSLNSSKEEKENDSDSKKNEDINKEKETTVKKEEMKEDSKENKEKQSKDIDEEKKNESRSTYTLNIKSGMPTSSISSELEQNGIIKNASDFTKYLEEHDFALKVKAKKVEVHSDMSYYELAHALTNY